MSDVLQISGAHKRFGDTDALSGVDLILRGGEWLGLLGPNGAGKTTLLRAIAGRVKLSGGAMTLLGCPLDSDSTNGEDARRRLGVVPQDIALYESLSALENLQGFGALHGVRGAALREAIEWSLTWTGLEDRAQAIVGTFSGGMKRRLNIACGVLHKPEVVILDEPTVGVDPQSRERIWQMLEDLRRGGASLLLTTHQLDEAQRVCDRIVIIDHGKIIADGTFDELVSRTVGRRRLVRLRLDRRPASLDGLGSFDDESLTLRREVDDVAGELGTMLTRVGGAGCQVADVRIDEPSLQAVFLHLTGRELRE